MPLEKILGLKLGDETQHSNSPVLTSITITEPVSGSLYSNLFDFIF